MAKKIPTAIVFLLLILVLLAWAPWQPKSARTQVERTFTTTWETVADGCGLACQGCGAKQAQKTVAGTLVSLEYACGLLPADSPEYHRTVQVYVSFLGTVHGLPAP